MAIRAIVSACLAAVPCRYDGRDRPDPAVEGLLARGLVLPVCPEQLGGLPTPRPPAEIRGGDGADVLAGRARVVTSEGDDVTEAFVLGARTALKVARACGARLAYLVDRSPSCGTTLIYDGSFEGRLRPGRGVTAALLQEQGIACYGPRDRQQFLSDILTEGRNNKGC